MIRSVTAICAGVLISVLVANPASAQVVRDKKTCSQAVADAREARNEAAVSNKIKAEIDELIRVADHLCGQANFVYAESLLQIARGMAAGE